MTDYKAIAAFLGAPYYFDLGSISLPGTLGPRILSDAGIVLAVLDKLAWEMKRPLLSNDPIEAISALVVAMKEGA